MRSPDHSQCSSRVVQGELLPKIDDDIDSVLGLAVFYQYVRTAALNQRQIQHVSFFTTKLFAHYLNIRCFLVSQKLLVNEVNQLISYISNKQLSITDVLSAKLVISNFHCQSITLHVSQQPVFSATDVNTSELVELLQQSAVEHLTTFRQLEARDFGSVATVVTTDFDALYAYKRGDYQRCLQLSTQNIQPLLYAEDIYSVPVFPEFIQLLCDDIVSLVALTLIVSRKRRYRDKTRLVISQLTLSLYLTTQCQMKLRYSVTSLARTLDYIESAVRKHPAYRPFDHRTLNLTKHQLLLYDPSRFKSTC